MSISILTWLPDRSVPMVVEAAVGRPVNLEVDMFAKYVEKLLGSRAGA